MKRPFKKQKNNSGWSGKNGKYKTMKKIKCLYCGKKFYNNGFSTHEYFCWKRLASPQLIKYLLNS